uniref:ATP synthase complex subunit 8 n=1 Tax=Foetorepus altivelis TaxID=215388 RepID=A0A060NQ15_9TELE|nr:ATPase subunit 8 [Foetorepus altivelis]
MKVTRNTLNVMPQLDPAPWFLIMTFSWTIFLGFMPFKIMSHAFPNKPDSSAKEVSTKNSWTWPW